MKLSAAPSESISSVHGTEVDELGVLISDQMESVVRAAVNNYGGSQGIYRGNQSRTKGESR